LEKGELKQAMKFQERFVEIREKLKIQISRNKREIKDTN
jgi:hypothetical protein